MKVIQLFSILTLLLVFSCSDNTLSEEACYQFDQRQCQVDEFGEAISSANQSQWANIMKNYLESKDIDVVEVKIDFQYYEAVCEACEVCPEAHRFYVKIDDDDQSKLEALDLMNMESADCSQFF